MVWTDAWPGSSCICSSSPPAASSPHSPPACSRRPGGVFGARVKGGRRGLRAPWPSRASPRLHALAGREQAGRYAILCTSVLRATRKILLLGTYNFPVETAPGHWPACHLAIRNPLRIGPEATRKIAGRPPDAPGPFSCCSPAHPGGRGTVRLSATAGEVPTAASGLNPLQGCAACWQVR